MSSDNLVARERWRILKSAILSTRWQEVAGLVDCSNASVRSFSSFGLFSVSTAESAHTEHPETELTGEWLMYSLRDGGDQTLTQHARTRPAPLIKVITQSTSLEDMMGFNNTGNVCIWPSEEVLAYYCLKHSHLFKGQSVCELGCGMSGLAGILLASTQLPKQVLLTDGNSTSIENIQTIISRNTGQFGSTAVTGEVLRWDQSFLATQTPLDAKFDWVLCADCLFFRDLHSALTQTILKLLQPGKGSVLIFAPGRSGTLDEFVLSAQEAFKFERKDMYDDVIYKKHQELLDKASGLYKPDLHYPLLLQLTPR